MEFVQSLKIKAQQIIELSEELADRTHTWGQEKSAPTGGYTDRAGFIIYDDIELFADVYAAEDGSECLLRARLAYAPKDRDQTLFTIITLDFNANREKVEALISDSNNLTQRDLVTLLQDAITTPKLIHVSFKSGKGDEGKKISKRYEYTAEDLEGLTEVDYREFVSTLDQAYEQIISKI